MEATSQVQAQESLQISLDEAVDSFSELTSYVMGLPEIHPSPSPEVISQKITLLERIESVVRREAVFSNNEELEEVPSEHLNFINIPFFIAMLLQRQTEGRLGALQKSKYLFYSYIDLLKAYESCPPFVAEQLKLFKDAPEGKKYFLDRDNKLKLESFKKAAEEEAKQCTVNYARGDIKAPKFYKILYAFNAFSALKELTFMDREIEMLEFREKLRTDDATKSAYDKERSKPSNKPKYWQIPAPGQPMRQVEIGDVGQGFNPQGAQGGYPGQGAQGGYPGHGNHDGHVCSPNPPPLVTNLEHQKEMMSKLFQHDHAQPRMTMDFHGELEYSLMVEKGEKMKAHDIKVQQEQDLLTEDEKEEIERLKTSEWDNYKDAHEKGAGNKPNCVQLQYT